MRQLYRIIATMTLAIFVAASASFTMAESVSEDNVLVPAITPANSVSNTLNETTEEEGTEKHEDVIMPELALVYGQDMIAIGDIIEDDKIECIFGKADSITSHTYSKDDGLNMDQLEGMTIKRYIYPGLVIESINSAEDALFFVSSIEITDTKYTTPRNIGVGDSLEQLKLAYPEGNLLGDGATDDDYRYQPADYWEIMNFHIKNGKIESIQIYMLLD